MVQQAHGHVGARQLPQRQERFEHAPRLVRKGLAQQSSRRHSLQQEQVRAAGEMGNESVGGLERTLNDLAAH
jgi:hypothetical protein